MVVINSRFIMRLFLSLMFVVMMSVVSSKAEAQLLLHDTTVVLSDSVKKEIDQLKKEVSSLKGQNQALKDLLREEQQLVRNKENEIDNLNGKIKSVESSYSERIKQLEANNDFLQRKLVSMASNFLYIP